MTWADRVTAVADESGGLLSLRVFRQSDMPDLLAHAVAGDPQASMLVGAIGDALQAVRNAPRKSPMRCGCCPRPFPKNPFSLVVALPEVESPMTGLSLGICGRCATEPEDIRDKAVVALRKLFPELKPVDLGAVHQGGQA